jgi:hypothetical protein
MYSTCAWPGCHVPVDRCEIHHSDDWLGGGPTNLDNLAPICIGHHHLIHDRHWTLTLKPNRTITITRPDGTHHHTGTTTNRMAGRGQIASNQAVRSSTTVAKSGAA